MIEIKNNLLYNSTTHSTNLNFQGNNFDILKLSSQKNTIINYYEVPTEMKASFSENEENEEYSCCNDLLASNNNINIEENNLNQENSFQTPVMNFHINNPNETQDENSESIYFQKSKDITSDTNGTSKISEIDIMTSLPNIENIVSTANLCVKLNLREIALKSKNAEYSPKRFSAVIIKIKEPKATGLIFSSGKIVCLGAKNEEESKRASRKIAKIIKSVGYPVIFKEFKIRNIVGSADVKCQISLINLYMDLMKRTLYKGQSFVAFEPEQFPGLIYRMIEPNIVILIFSSGKLVLTGGKKNDDIYDGFKKIYPLLIKYKTKKQWPNNKALQKEIDEKMKK